MFKPFDLLENVLNEIEKDIRNGINADTLAKRFELSSGHLQRLFKFAFKQPIAGYIRSRRLAASLDDLLKNDINVLDIAIDYGFEYEQSYIRAFKREFGITPGDLRKSGKILKVKPPYNLFDENKLQDGILFGPDIVMVPQFHIIGTSRKISFDDSVTMAPKVAIQFWEHERKNIKNVINPNVYIGMTFNINCETEDTEYITSVQVKNTEYIPRGYKKFTFEKSLCARFRYIGKHHYYDINAHIAGAMYNVIWNFAGNDREKYALLNNKLHFEKIDISMYDGTYCRMEWFAPVYEKNKGLGT